MTFINERREQFGVEPILRVLGIAASTYYDWTARRRQPSRRQQADVILLDRIRAVYERSGGTYGAPRVHAQPRGCTPSCAATASGWAASGWSG
jgi:putative transposase